MNSSRLPRITDTRPTGAHTARHARRSATTPASTGGKLGKRDFGGGGRIEREHALQAGAQAMSGTAGAQAAGLRAGSGQAQVIYRFRDVTLLLQEGSAQQNRWDFPAAPWAGIGGIIPVPPGRRKPARKAQTRCRKPPSGQRQSLLAGGVFDMLVTMLVIGLWPAMLSASRFCASSRRPRSTR